MDYDMETVRNQALTRYAHGLLSQLDLPASTDNINIVTDALRYAGKMVADEQRLLLHSRFSMLSDLQKIREIDLAPYPQKLNIPKPYTKQGRIVETKIKNPVGTDF